MSTPRHVPWSFILLGAVMACTQSEAGPSPESLAADRAAVDALREREVAVLASGNVDSISSVYAEDIDMMPPNEPALSGLAAVRPWVEGMFSQVSIEAEYLTSSVEIVGDWAIDRYTGRITVTPKAGGAPMTETIKGFHIARRQPDGSWKIVKDTWNTDAPPPPAAGAPAP
jgi:ketosteroid isomerase-like protein